MLFVSLILVIVAAVTLILGVFQPGLELIYVSIGTCVAAMAVLGAGVLLRRRQTTSARPPASYGAGAPAPAAGRAAPGRAAPGRAAAGGGDAAVSAARGCAEPASAEPSSASVATPRGSLSEIKDLSPAKRDVLLARFGSEDGVAAASEAELHAVPGIGARLAAAIKHHLA
jgi:hypothetical protein